MRGFMPSEVARLVLGYLKETKCEKSVGMFLNESPHLREYVECLLKGREFPTSINGYSLSDLLYDYQFQSQQSQSSGHINAPLSMCTRDLLLSARNQHKPKLVSVGCGDDKVCGMRQTSCQTSPEKTQCPGLVNMNSNRVEEEPRIEIPAQLTPDRLPAISSFTTPCRPMDLYSSPSSLIKSALYNLHGCQITPVKSGEGETSLDRTNSPRRKDCYPRKRLYSPGASASPSSARKRFHDNYESGSSCFSSPSVDAENAVSTTGGIIEKTLIENLLQNSALQEVIAANINDGLPDATISIPESADEQLSDTITNIVNRTEADPAFDSFLKSIFPDKIDCNATESLMNATETQAKGDDVGSAEKTVNVRTGDWSTATATTSAPTTSVVENNTVYLLPSSNNTSLVQLVIGGVSSSDEIYTVNESQAQVRPTAESSKNHTMSPIKVVNADMYDRSRIIRKKKNNPSESLKQNFVKRQCAVKSLNFQSNNVSIVDHSKLRPANQKELPIGSRLMSLIKTVETQTKKPVEKIAANKNNSNKVEQVRKENTLSKPPDKSGGKPNKTSQNMELVNKTTEKDKPEAVLNNVNIDNILSNVPYVD